MAGPTNDDDHVSVPSPSPWLIHNNDHQQRHSSNHHHFYPYHPDVDLVIVNLKTENVPLPYDDDERLLSAEEDEEENSLLLLSVDDSATSFSISSHSVLDDSNTNDDSVQTQKQVLEQQTDFANELNIYEFLCDVKIVESNHDSCRSIKTITSSHMMLTSSTTGLFDDDDIDTDHMMTTTKDQSSAAVLNKHRRKNNKKKKHVTFSLLYDDDDSSLIAPSCIYLYENPLTSLSYSSLTDRPSHHDSNQISGSTDVTLKQSIFWTEDEIKRIRRWLKEKSHAYRRSSPQNVQHLLQCYFDYHERDNNILPPNEQDESHFGEYHMYDDINIDDHDPSTIISTYMMNWVSSEENVRGLEKKIASKIRQSNISAVKNILNYQETLLYQYECEQHQQRQQQEERSEAENEDLYLNTTNDKNNYMEDNSNGNDTSFNRMKFYERDSFQLLSAMDSNSIDDHDCEKRQRDVIIIPNLNNNDDDDESTTATTATDITPTTSSQQDEQCNRDHHHELIRKCSLQNSYRSRLFSYRMALCDAIHAKEIHQNETQQG